MGPLISVCIPAYEQPEALSRAVRSALAQEGCEFEIVITDDSPDDQIERALEVFSADPRIIYFRNQIRLGAVRNWNESVRRASGQIIKILHHDDWFDSTSSLIKAVEPIIKGKVHLTFSACRAMSLNEKELFVHCASESQLRELSNFRDCLAYTNFVGPPSVVAFDRSLNIKFDPRYTWLSDVDFYLRALDATNGQFLYLKTPLMSTTAESPLQLSRDCETNRVRSISEYVLLFSSRTGLKSCGFRTVSHFSELIYGLTSKDFFPLIGCAFRFNSFGMVVCLFVAKILPRRIFELFKWK